MDTSSSNFKMRKSGTCQWNYCSQSPTERKMLLNFHRTAGGGGGGERTLSVELV